MLNIPPLSQQDPRWRDIALGFSDSQTTIGTDGCTLTCLTMVANGFGFHETPDSLNQKLKNLGAGRGFMDALIVWSGLPQALPEMVLVNLVGCREVAAPLDMIDATLDAGKPIVVEVDRTLAPGVQNHWVVIYDRHDGDYLIHDPWPVPAEPSARLVERYGQGRTAAEVITYVVLYDGPGETSGSQPVSQPVDGDTSTVKLVVVVNDDPDIQEASGLKFREAPINGAVKAQLQPGTQLEVQEPAPTARAKIGVTGQWLNVSGTQGTSIAGETGFVAAWYVHAKDEGVSKALEAKAAFDTFAGIARSGSEVQPPLRRKRRKRARR